MSPWNHTGRPVHVAARPRPTPRRRVGVDPSGRTSAMHGGSPRHIRRGPPGRSCAPPAGRRRLDAGSARRNPATSRRTPAGRRSGSGRPERPSSQRPTDHGSGYPPPAPLGHRLGDRHRQQRRQPGSQRCSFVDRRRVPGPRRHPDGQSSPRRKVRLSQPSSSTGVRAARHCGNCPATSRATSAASMPARPSAWDAPPRGAVLRRPRRPATHLRDGGPDDVVRVRTAGQAQPDMSPPMWCSARAASGAVRLTVGGCSRLVFWAGYCSPPS